MAIASWRGRPLDTNLLMMANQPRKLGFAMLHLRQPRVRRSRVLRQLGSGDRVGELVVHPLILPPRTLPSTRHETASRGRWSLAFPPPLFMAMADEPRLVPTLVIYLT